MKKFFFIILSVFSIAACISPADACEPCVKNLSIEETIAKSDLIIVGERVEEGPLSGGEEPHGPDWIKVNISRILKGTEENNPVVVNSWDAMCDYGLVIGQGEYLMFLTRRGSPEEPYQYDAVDFGCGVKSFPLIDGAMIVNEEALSLDDFIVRYLAL